MKTLNIFSTLFMLTALIVTSAYQVNAQTLVEQIEVPAFTRLNVGGIYKVEFIQSDEYALEIEAEEKYMENAEWNVKNGTLNLNITGTTMRNLSITARIKAPYLEKVSISGASSFSAMNTMESESLELNISGASSATLGANINNLRSNVSGASSLNFSGVANHHKLIASGASQVRALELETETTEVTTSGAAFARIWAKENLKATASGTSRVSFEKQPLSQQFSTSGMASINNQRGLSKTSGDADTTRIRLGGRDLLIIDDEGSGKSCGLSRKTFKGNWAGFELGINGYLSPDNSISLEGEADEYINLRYNKSVVVNLNLFQQSFPLFSPNMGLVTGVGLGWNNYRFDNQTRLVHNNAGVEFYEDTENNLTKNKITLTWINIPLMVEFQNRSTKQSERFHIAGGMILGTRIGSHAKYVYDDSGKKRKDKDYNDFNIQPFRFDLTGRIGWGRVNLFATYSLNSLFKEGKGPELYPFSIGMRILSF